MVPPVDDEGVDAVLGEEFAGAVDAVFALREANGRGLGTSVGERGEGRWEAVITGAVRGRSLCLHDACSGRGGGSGKKEAAA